MEWLPSVLVLAVGIVLLVLLVVSVLGPLRRVRAASRTMTVAITGRMMRVRAAVAELNAWRASRHGGDIGA
jgi:hypothetical protein